MLDPFSIGTAIAGRTSFQGSEIAPLGVFRGLRLANSQNDELSHFEVFSVLFGRKSSAKPLFYGIAV
jgi:hypothetical protein